MSPERSPRTDLGILPAEVGRLSVAYSDVVREGRAVYEGSWIPGPVGKRVEVLVPEEQWQKLAAAICAITGGDVV